MRKGTLLAALAATALAACGAREAEVGPAEPALLIQSRVVFVAADGRTPRQAPATPLRLWLPHLVGDLYGSPNEGEVAQAALRPDLTFALDLNGAERALEKALVPTTFSQRWMAIEPANARVARLIPYVMPADSIGPVGISEWLDEQNGDRLMLLYVDRPARIRGDIVYEGRHLQFDIEASQAGYLWVRQPQGDGTFRASSAPARLVLGVFPPE